MTQQRESKQAAAEGGRGTSGLTCRSTVGGRRTGKDEERTRQAAVRRRRLDVAGDGPEGNQGGRPTRHAPSSTTVTLCVVK